MSSDQRPTARAPRRPWFALLGGLIAGMLISGLLLIFVAMPAALSHRQDLPFERQYGQMAIALAASRAAGETKNPLAGNSQAIQRGRIAYTGSCAVCHGATGDGRGSFGAALYPPASNLQVAATQEKTDAELFWIVKNGLSFLGMPAYSDRYDDTDIWSIVAYLRMLPDAERRRPAQMPPPFTDDQLVVADPTGDPTSRGAAIYFAQGCNLCHGAIGNGQGTLQLLGSRNAQDAVRKGRRGMPAYNKVKLTDAELTDLIEYLKTLAVRQRG